MYTGRGKRLWPRIIGFVFGHVRRRDGLDVTILSCWSTKRPIVKMRRSAATSPARGRQITPIWTSWRIHGSKNVVPMYVLLLPLGFFGGFSWGGRFFCYGHICTSTAHAPRRADERKKRKQNRFVVQHFFDWDECDRVQSNRLWRVNNELCFVRLFVISATKQAIIEKGKKDSTLTKIV